MPTIASQPSLRSHQAIGALLLDQFARQRFIEAGVDDKLIGEAESNENFDRLTASLLQDEEDSKQGLADLSNLSNVSSVNNSKSFDATNSTTLLQNSHHEEENGFNGNNEHYQSIVDQTNMTTLSANNNTIYHSINAGNGAPALDRLQASGAIASYGRELRRIAEEFETNPLRIGVKERAEQVSLADINRESFLIILDELFQDGITRERFVVLFFFCTDVALRAVSYAEKLVVDLMGWSFSYIINTVFKILFERFGGWDEILQVTFRQLSYLPITTCCAAVGICLFAVLLHKSLNSKV